MSSLMYLNLAGTRLYGTIPTELGKCKALYSFSVYTTHVVGKMPLEICALPSANSTQWTLIASCAITSASKTSRNLDCACCSDCID
jgi:hypothetical protein